jgi:hypothetical protein
MKPDIRKQFNEAFTDKKYQTYIKFIEKVQGGPLRQHRSHRISFRTHFSDAFDGR